MRDKTLGWIIVGVLIALLASPFLLLAGDQAWFGDKRATIDTPTVPLQILRRLPLQGWQLRKK